MVMELINGFVHDCKVRGMTDHGIQTYRSQVKSFLRAYSEPACVTTDELRTFLAGLRDRKLSSSTLRGYFAAISSFYDFLVFEGVLHSNPVILFRKRYLVRLKMHSETRQLVSIKDVRELISSAGTILDRALIAVLVKTGMRRGELLSLRIEDLDFRNSIIRIPFAAKRTNCIAFMDDELKEILEEYFSWRHEFAKSSWLWTTKQGGRIHKDYPNRMLADLGASLGLHAPGGPLCCRLTCHAFRHHFTSSLFHAGMNPEYIKWLRGDSLNREAWEIYNHIDQEEVRQEYLRRIPKLISFDEKLARYV
jgi:integrase/recombinase XerD